MDETYNFNAVKLHELYFSNISDVDSEIRVDSIPYMKLSRDWGTFEAWQEDFMAACMASRNGWALTVYEPYRSVFMNITVDSHDKDIPLGCVPVIVMDMWEHAYFKDYGIDKKAYLFAMMKELNWDVIEARMSICERSNLDILYKIEPLTKVIYLRFGMVLRRILRMHSSNIRSVPRPRISNFRRPKSSRWRALRPSGHGV